MPNHLVSIITTTRNRKVFLEKLIKNILEQDYKNIEHIVVDALSTDGTQDLLRSYEKTYNLKWISERDRMQTEGVNKGLRMAMGDLITITHDDDYWLPDGLGRLVEEFERNSELALVYGDGYSLFSDGHQERVRYRHYSMTDMINGGYQIPQHTALIRRSWLNRVGWLDEEIEHVAEYELFLRIIRAGGQYRHVAEPVAVALQHSHKASWVCWNHSWDETWQVNRRHGGRLWSTFALVYLKNRYLKNFSSWLQRRLPRLLRWLKLWLKTPTYE